MKTTRKIDRGLLRNIRRICLECKGNNSEKVKLCTKPCCQMYPHRFGLPPNHFDPVYIEREDRYTTLGKKGIKNMSRKHEKEAQIENLELPFGDE